MMSNGTPKDYSEDLYKFYFEVGEYQGVALGIFESFVGQVQSGYISPVEFGYELAIPIQSVPDLVRSLCEENIAIYQIVRIEKITESKK